MELRLMMNEILSKRLLVKIDGNGRGYEIVAEYEAESCQVTPSYIRATTVELPTATAMFYSLCYNQCFIIII
jgi:hypothetical protein